MANTTTSEAGGKVNTVRSPPSSINIRNHDNNTWSFQVVSYPSTIQAQCCLTSAFEWKLQLDCFARLELLVLFNDAPCETIKSEF